MQGRGCRLVHQIDGASAIGAQVAGAEGQGDGQRRRRTLCRRLHRYWPEVGQATDLRQ
jgi:hypothetical protein